MEKYLRYFFIPFSFITICNITLGQSSAPVITYTPATNVYTVNTTITTLSPTNTGGAVTANSLTTFSTDPTGQPYGIAYDPTTGDIITDSYSGGAVYRYSPSGVLLNTYTTSIHTSGPKDIVVDNSGNIYVANGVGANVVKITPTGTTTTITATGTAFNQPDGMTIDRVTGDIYVADQGTGIVYKIAPGATTATVYKSGFTNLYGVTVNSSTGVVYVSEYTPSADIKQISTTGVVTTFVSKAAGGFSDLRNLDIDAAGNIFVANYGNNSIDEFSSTGAFLGHIVTGLNQPRATAEDVFGNLYIANSGSSNIKEYSTAYYSINIPLPAGMNFDTTTGQISGTPSVTSPTTVYTIVGHNASGSGYTTVTITVDPTGPTATGAALCGTGIATLTASGGAPSGGTYNWYAAASGGSSLATGATYSPTVSATTTYYVDYAQGGVTCAARTAVTVTVGANPVISTAPTSGAYFSYGFTAGSVSDISGSNTGTLRGAPTTTSDRYAASGNAYSFVSSSSQYISTATSYATPGPLTFSISLWFKTSTAGGYLAGFGDAQTGNSTNVDRVIYIGSNGQLYFGLQPGGVKKTLNTITVYNDGKWHHVVATSSAISGSNMYVDGALAASDPTMNAVLATTGYWRVAYDVLTGWTNAPATAYFNGSLDDIAVANTELTPAQINVLYGAGSSSTFCTGNALSLTANTVSGATYSWVGPSGSGFTSALQNPTVPAANAVAGIYVLTVIGASGCTSIINVTAPSNVVTYTWSGTAGTTNPTTAGNWDHLPPFTNTSNLVIPAGLSQYPVLTANESIYSLTIASGATFSLGGFTLNVGCNIVNNASTGGTGILYGSNNSSGINWNGSLAAQSYTGTNTANTAQLGFMTVNNSTLGTVSIYGGPVDIYSLLTMVNGNLAVSASPAALTLKSTSTQTANVAAVPSSCSITGNVNVERFIQGSSASGNLSKRGYRLLSSAVYTGTDASGSHVFDLQYLLNNIYVSGTGMAANGFNVTTTSNPSIYLFREDDKPPAANGVLFRTQYNWKGVAKINNSPAYNIGTQARNTIANVADTTATIPVGNGILCFFRGNNTPGGNGTTTGSQLLLPYNYPDDVTLTQTGTLNTGTINVKLWFAGGASLGNNFSYTTTWVGYGTSSLTGGYSFVGNPYASTINWEKYNNTNAAGAITGGGGLTGKIWVFNVASKQYQPYMPLTNGTDLTSERPSSLYTGSASNFIASGQGFFVKATATGQSLTFTEAAKISAQPASANLHDLMGKPKEFTESPTSIIRLKLIQDTINTDEIVIALNNKASTKFVDNEDAEDLGGTGATVSLSSSSLDSVQLAINSYPLPGLQQETIPLMVDATDPGMYQLNRTQLDNLPALYDVWLKDAFMKDSLDMKANSTYLFTIDKNNPATFGNNRFTIVIRQNPAAAYRLLDFTATKASPKTAVQLIWKTENEENYTNFTVERSTDGGKTFNIIGGLRGTGAGSYSLLDQAPVIGQNLYRLKQEDINNVITYSNVVSIQYSEQSNNLAKTGINVYPNPVASTINLSIESGINTSATYNILITNSEGFLIRQDTMKQFNWQADVSNLLPGTYIIKVLNNKSVIGSTKFVKL
jgi:hypothetical protein